MFIFYSIDITHRDCAESVSSGSGTRSTCILIRACLGIKVVKVVVVVVVVVVLLLVGTNEIAESAKRDFHQTINADDDNDVQVR